jgi:hypothetical protein
MIKRKKCLTWRKTYKIIGTGRRSEEGEGEGETSPSYEAICMQIARLFSWKGE